MLIRSKEKTNRRKKSKKSSNKRNPNNRKSTSLFMANFLVIGGGLFKYPYKRGR